MTSVPTRRSPWLVVFSYAPVDLQPRDRISLDESFQTREQKQRQITDTAAQLERRRGNLLLRLHVPAVEI